VQIRQQRVELGGGGMHGDRDFDAPESLIGLATRDHQLDQTLPGRDVGRVLRDDSLQRIDARFDLVHSNENQRFRQID